MKIANQHNKKAAIIYHYFAHYRLPILKELSKSDQIDYIFYSDKTSGLDIKTISAELANLEKDKGGLEWQFLKNIWIYKHLFLWQKGMMKIALKSNYDYYVLLGNFFYISTWVATIILRLRNKKVFFWSHGVTSDSNDIKWSIRKFFYNLSNGLMLYGNNAKKVMIKNGFKPEKLNVIYNSLDYEKQLFYRVKLASINVDEVRASLFKNPDLPQLVFVGRLTFQKKLKMLVDAAKQLHSNGFKVNILFIGNGVDKDNLKQLVSEYKLNDYFNFFGACYDEGELSKLLFSSDVCVSPGEVGLTVITSLGYGTPVITHNDFNYQMPEYEAIESGVNGNFFDRGSVESMSNVIKEWLESQSKISRLEMAEKCYKVIDEKYNPKIQVSLISEILLSHE